MDRGRGRRYDDRDDSFGGETYRPSDRRDRSPPRNGSYRGPRRGRSPPRDSNYAPRGGRNEGRPRSRSPRRRSRSPAMRGRDNGGGYRGRPRSPPAAHGRPRSPLPQRRYSRSPHGGSGRVRSPIPQKRAREVTPPAPYRQRSPPPSKQGRYAEPMRDNHERRGYSPVREQGQRLPRENNYRPRERSRTPPPRPSAHASRRVSPNSSRRSSPPVHPDRMVVDERSPAYADSRRDYPTDRRSPPPRARDPSPPRRARSPVPRSPIARSPPRESPTWRERSPAPRDREPPRRVSATPNTWSNEQMSAPSGPSHRNGDARPPPANGSSRYDDYPADRNTSGPPSAPISMSAHNRPNILSAPTRPRGSPSFARDNPRDTRDAPYNNAPHHRGRGRDYNAPHPRHDTSSGPPTGPRSGHSGPEPYPSPRYSDPPRVPFRPNNSSSTTYPRTQRFNTHLASVPALVDGGKKLPSGLDAAQEKRLQQLEEDRKKLLDVIEEKQRVKRAGLREWEKSEREAGREGLRSELAEGHLGRLSGEGGAAGGGY
ncbi:hypothetical protein MMC17_005476 [Xylographa soralifera]|nr:hypothetical protein [Xylographa soralifera]